MRFALFAAVITVLGCGSSASPSEGPPSTPPADAPTYYRDVEPIVQVQCMGCHFEGGSAPFAFDANTAHVLAKDMATRVETGSMPPWPPGPKGKALHGARVLTSAEIALIRKWADAGALVGDAKDHKERTANKTFDPGRAADLEVMMKTDVYEPPPSSSPLNDEVRCFVIDIGNPENIWVKSIEWVAGQPQATHHLGGMAIDAANAAKARGFYGKDGRSGYECAGGIDTGGIAGVAGFGATAAGKDTGKTLSGNGAVFVPAGSSLLLTVHYVVRNVTKGDRSGVRFWLAKGAESKTLRPTVESRFAAPSELPCPSGVSTDPTNPCSREYALAHIPNETAEVAKARNDFVLAKCGTTLAAHHAKLAFSPADPSKFLVGTSCELPIPHDGLVRLVSNHMHTRGAAARIEVQKPDGTWDLLLDIPKWRWAWESTYSLIDPVKVSAGQKLRVSCDYDNGTANQWSVDGQPGHDGPATPPLQPPRYIVGGAERGLDMCGAFVTIERTAYKDASYASICAEAQSIYDEACTDKAIDFSTPACTGALENLAVLLVSTSKALVKPLWCVPKGPAASVGATCELLSNCALACAATRGVAAGFTDACKAECAANVNAFKPALPNEAASPAAIHRFDHLAACANEGCKSKATWQELASCLGVACTELARACYAK